MRNRSRLQVSIQNVESESHKGHTDRKTGRDFEIGCLAAEAEGEKAGPVEVVDEEKRDES